jgi:hypothetical protein
MGSRAPQKPPTGKPPCDARKIAGQNPPAPKDRPEPPDPPPPPALSPRLSALLGELLIKYAELEERVERLEERE